MAQANFEQPYESDPLPDEHVQDPGLTRVPTPEELADKYFMAAEFAATLQGGEYSKATSDAERASLAPGLAYAFIQQKIKARADAGDERFMVAPVVIYGTLHSVMHNYNQKYKPGTNLPEPQARHREDFLTTYGAFAMQESEHPEIHGTLWLIEHAHGLGRPDIVQAGRELLAEYGRAMEIVGESHLRPIDPYQEIS